MTTTAAKQMLELIYAKQFLKRAEGLLDSAASSYKKRVSMADNAMAKLTAPKPATAPIAAPSSAPPATKLTRWPFDRPGTGDAQARAAIVDGAKQLGSKLPTPSSSYAYGPGGGGAGLPDVAGAARGAVRAVSEALPKPSSSYAYGPGGGGATAGKPTGFDSRKATADYRAKLDRDAAAAQQTPPQRSTYAYGMGPASAAGQAQIAAAQTTAIPPASSVQNPLTQPVPGRNIELMPDGTPDTSSLIDTPQTQTPPSSPAAPAGNSPQAWGSAGAGPGGAPATAPQQAETQQAAQPTNQSQPQQQPAVDAKQTPAQTVDTKPYESVLNDPKATPEQKEGARADYAKKWLDANSANVSPELRESAAAWQKDPNSPQAKAFAEQLGSAGDLFKQQQIAAAIADTPEAANNPDLFGQIVAGAENMWNSMGPMGQMALAIGVPLAMVGLLGNNGLGLILGGLGLGFAGASGGLFGDAAQQFAHGMSDYAATALGGLFGGEATGGQPPAAEGQSAATASAPTPEQAQQLASQQTQFLTEAKQDPRAFVAKITADPNKYAPTLLKMPNEQVMEMYKAMPPDIQAAFKSKLAWAKWGVKDKSLHPEIDRIQELLKTSAVIVMRKAARCWAGYEPVPGKKPYSNDSCRPIGSKKEKKKTEKKAVQSFDEEHARRVFREHPVPGMNADTATPTQLFTRMRNLVNPMSSHKNSTTAQLFREHYRNQMPLMPQPRPAPIATTAAPQSQTPAAPAQATPAPQPTIPRRPTMTQAPTNTAAPPPIQPGSGGRRAAAPKPPEDPVAAINKRLSQRGIDPTKPVFTRPAQPVVAAPQLSRAPRPAGGLN